MKWPEVSEIAKQRNRLGINQKKLAELSGVGQPVISRIENNNINPSYKTARKLFEALENYRASLGDEGRELVAEEIMNKDVLWVKPDEPVKEVWERMHDKGYSQVPVVDDRGRVLGAITENAALLRINDRTLDVMTEPFPIVAKDTRLSVLRHFLQETQAVLVVEKGKLIGIITAWDLAKTEIGRT